MKSRINHCIVCKYKINRWGICDCCRNDPFKVEEFRDYLSKKEMYSKLRKTYTKDYKEIKNINTEDFWDLKFLTSSDLNYKNDHMMKKKIKDISTFLKRYSGKLLDIGIGLGNLEKKLVKVNNEIQLFGIDTSEVAIKKNRQVIKGKFLNASIFNIPFKRDFFDIVVCLEVLEHISPLKLFIALREINKTLKKGGIFIVSVPLNEGLEELLGTGINPNCHVRNYTYSVINAELKMFGFSVLKHKYYFAFKKYFFIKDIIIRNFLKNFRRPNNLLVFSVKNL